MDDLVLVLAVIVSLSFLLGLASLGSQGKGLAILKSVQRSPWSRVIGGVCAGLGEHTQIPTWLWRTVFVLLALCGGIGVVIYLLFWLFIPRGEVALPSEAPLT